MRRRDFIRLVSLASLALATSRLSLADDSSKVKYYGAFSELPVGAVKPGGWIQKWLERQATGLSGHPENMGYPYDTCMYAGVIPRPSVPHGDNWWPYEQSGYFFDGTARLNQLIDNPLVRQRHQAELDYILSHSTDRGYGASTWGWPNVVVGRGLLADLSATGDPRISSIMEKFLTNYAGFDDRDGVNAEEALSLYGLTGNPELLTYAQEAFSRYFKSDRYFCSAEKINDPHPLREHGVTGAELLKIAPLIYLYTGNPEALDLAKKAYDKVIADSLMPDGGIVSNESLDTAAFDSIHESCDISDWSWSMGYCLMATGDAKWADIIERTIFNALPGAVSKDFKQLQYFSDANQIISTALSNHGGWSSTRMSYRASHETECCGGNINRAMPNYVIRQWMKTPDDGLAAVLYGASEVTTTLKGQPVTITQATDYPFRETIFFKIKTPKPVVFGLHLRIPGWCNAAKIMINGNKFTGKAEAGTFATISGAFKNGDVIQLTLPMEVRAEKWFQGESVAISRGPLVFSLKIEEKRVELTKDTPQTEAKLLGHLIEGFPALEFYPKSEWRYGIDLKSALRQIKVVESPMTDNPFLSGQVPIHLEVPLRQLPNWQPNWNAEPPHQPNGELVAVKTPGKLPSSDEKQKAKPATMKVMIPYGATYLRLTTLPIVGEA